MLFKLKTFFKINVNFPEFIAHCDTHSAVMKEKVELGWGGS